MVEDMKMRKAEEMHPENRLFINAILKEYGARLGDNDVIFKGEKGLPIRCVRKGARLRMESITTGALRASGPLSSGFISEFLERFWGWEKA